ncbi:hypothetical protein D3C77_617330 [compost metagenome]
MANRLAVAADGADLPRLEVVLTEQRCNALGGQRCPLLFRQRGAGQFVVSGAAQGQQLLAKGRRHRNIVVAEQPGAVVLLDQRYVQTVQAGPGHDAEIERHTQSLRASMTERS